MFTITAFQLADAAIIDYGSGFSGSGMTLNGSAIYSGNQLQLTSVFTSQNASAFYGGRVDVQSFTTDFTIRLTNANADGMTFVIQNESPYALGESGGALGYGGGDAGGLLGIGGSKGIGNSVAVKFDLYDNEGEGTNSTGLYINGAPPTLPSIAIPTINLRSGNPLSVHLTYDGATLAMTLKDTVTGDTFNQSWEIDIPNTVGGNTAYVGFTAGTGGRTATQKVLSWTLSSGSVQPPPPPPATVSVSPASATLVPGGTQQFTANVSGTGNTDVTWSVAGGGGSVSASGLYTAVSAAGTATVVATSVADPTKSASAIVTVTAAPACATGSTTWTGNRLGLSQSGSFTISFDVTSPSSITDANFALSQNVPAAYTDLAAIVRFNPAGMIDVRNGTSYRADFAQPYSANSIYHFVMAVNVTSRTYTVYVTPPDGVQQALATNYAFRGEHANISSLNYWTSYTDPYDAPLQVCNLQIASAPPTAVSVSVSPALATLVTGSTQQFTASVSGASNTAVTWSVASGGGTVSASGLYTAASTAGTAIVVATSVADPSASAVANVAVNTAPAALLSASPTSLSFGSLLLGLLGTKTVTLTNTGNSPVTIFSATTQGSAFNLPGLVFPMIVAPNASQTVTIAFLSSLGGVATGSVSFVSSATNSPTTVALSGSGTAPQPHSVTLSWQAGNLSVAGYNIYRAATSGGPYTKVNSAVNSGTSFVDDAVQAGQTYHYTVTSVSSSGLESVYSNQVTAVIPTP